MQTVTGKVLVVDDDPRNLLAIREILNGPATDVTIADSGEEALRLVLKEDFAVILLDVRMPQVDGYEVAAMIRARPRSSRIPIIFLTAFNRDELHVFRGYSAGAVDFVFKPIEPFVLKSKVDVFVELYRKTEEIRLKGAQERQLLLENLEVRNQKLKAERALRRRDEHQSIILQSLPIALYTQTVGDAHRKLSFVDENIEVVTGFPAKKFLTPNFWESRLVEGDLDRVIGELGSLQKAGATTLEYKWLCADEKPHYILDQSVNIAGETGATREIFGIWLDVTDRKELEQQVIHASKLEAVGRLTGGIAHDFNNMLSLVMGNLDLLARSFENNEKAQKRVQLSISAAQRCADLTNRLLTFSRKQPVNAGVINLGEELSWLIDLLQRAIGEHIRVKLSAGEGIWPVQTDKAQLEAALVNLAVNARDAMPGGGELTVGISNEESRQMIHISVSDTGAGMPQEIINKVFEPFFTTKKLGTGLGLSMVHGFVQQSRGEIEIDSVPGKGTIVSMYLPRCREEIAEIEAESISRTDSPEIIHGEERILVVEDEYDVRLMTVSTLESFGYTVFSIDSADAALALLEGDSAFDLVISDVKMPGKVTGLGFARIVRDRWPGVQILLVSGYVEPKDQTSEFVLLEKPFRAAAFAKTVREILDTRSASAGSVSL